MALEILTYGFMHRALISGIAIAILCSVVGLFLVLRRYSLFGDAIAHSSFGGIALGLLAGVYPLWTAYGVSIVSALIITKIKDQLGL
jgi:zinc transport system permease protein